MSEPTATQMSAPDLPSTAAAETLDVLSSAAAGPAAVRGGALRVGSFLAGTLVSLGAAALLYRHLGVWDTGRYATATSLSAVVTGFTDLGLTAIGVRELSLLTGAERAAAARTLLGLRLTLTVVGVLAVSGFAWLAYGPFLALGVLVAGGGVLVQNTQTTLSVPLLTQLRFGWVSALDLARQVVVAALIAGFVVLGARLLPLLATAGIGALVVLPPTAWLVRRLIPLRPSFRVADWWRLLGPVITYSAAAAAGTLYFRAAIILVSLIAGSQELGYFSLSFKVVEVLLVLPGLLVGAAFPVFARAARDDPARLAYAIARVFEASLLLGVWMALSFAVGARLAIDVIGGGKFGAAAPVLAAQGVGLGASFVGAVWAYGMLSLHLHRLILAFNLGMLAAVIFLVAILAGLDGAEGAAIGTATAEVGGAIVGGILLVRGRAYLRPSLRGLPRVGLAALLGATPAVLGSVPVIGRLVLSSAVYFAALLLLRAVPAEVFDILPAGLRPGRAGRG